VAKKCTTSWFDASEKGQLNAGTIVENQGADKNND